jgi:LuxR family quorum sensing-dependent transcriptional regulator
MTQASDALDLIETLGRTSTTDAVLDEMRRVLARFGFEYFCFASLPRPRQQFEDVMLAVRVPSEWIRIYCEQQYLQVDPAIRHARSTSFPFEWKDAPYDADKEPRAAEMVRRVTELGLSEGVMVPIYGAAGCEGVVWMGGRRLELTRRVKAMLHLVGLYAFDHVRHLRRALAPAGRKLSERELEILTWVAQGKTAWEVGEILGISSRTVNTHTQVAFQKLGAVNRTQAIAIALRERLIAP